MILVLAWHQEDQLEGLHKVAVLPVTVSSATEILPAIR